MIHEGQSLTIVMADDDEDDQLFAAKALAESRLANELHFVNDGEMLMDYLLRRGEYVHLQGRQLPGLILLDLNMPRKDGYEALKEIKSHPSLRHIPVVILTTSKSDIDVFLSYDSGANSFISKPVTFDGLVNVMRDIGQYWFKIVELPKN